MLLSWQYCICCLICLFLSLIQQTPLHIAAGGGYTYTVKHLVKEGADINIKDKKGVWEYTIIDNKWLRD